MSGLELVPSSTNVRRSAEDECDTDLSSISSLTSEQHAPSASLAHQTRAPLLVSTVTANTVLTVIFQVNLVSSFPFVLLFCLS